MTTVKISNVRKNIYSIIDQVIKYNKPVKISTKNGNAVIISEQDYNNIMETLYIFSIPGLKNELKKAMAETFDECIPEEKVKL